LEDPVNALEFHEPAVDSLDRFRQAVEAHLAARDVTVEDEDLEPFFDHVIAEYESGATPPEAARRWAPGPKG
jgi:hypothetical protein